MKKKTEWKIVELLNAFWKLHMIICYYKSE